MTRLVRRAISEMRKSAETHPAGFGRLLCETAGISKLGDGLTYERRMRAEWDKRK